MSEAVKAGSGCRAKAARIRDIRSDGMMKDQAVVLAALKVQGLGLDRCLHGLSTRA